MPKIFITRPIPDMGINLLKEAGYEVMINDPAEDRPATREELLENVKDTDAILSVLTEKIDSEIMDASPNLKIIANYAVGYDNIDLEEAKKRNIVVTNTPDVLTESVAEHTFSLMLALAHRVVEGDKFMRSGKYKAWGPKLLLGTNISGKTLGIIGLGRIGTSVAKHAVKGFGMKVLYNDLEPRKEFEDEFGAEFLENIDDIISRSDFISIHIPLLDSTRHLINEERLKAMKESAFLVNTSRGAIIDEGALLKALKENWIKGAGIDVFENEPEIYPGLSDLSNIIVTPHIASATTETRNKMSEIAAQNIIKVLSGEKAITPVLK